MYFTIPEDTDKYSKEEIIKLKDKEWLELSITLCPECLNEVMGKRVVLVHSKMGNDTIDENLSKQLYLL